MATRMTQAEVVQIHGLREEGIPALRIATAVGRDRETVRRALNSKPSDWPVVWPPPKPYKPPPSPSVPPPPNAGLPMRQARARVRSDLITGRRTLGDVLHPVDPAVSDLALAEVVRLQWTASRRRAVPALEELGRQALSANVNLMMAAGRASGYSRAWVAEHGSKWARPRADREEAA